MDTVTDQDDPTQSADYVPVFQYRGSLNEEDIERMMENEEDDDEYGYDDGYSSSKDKKKRKKDSSKKKKKKKHSKHHHHEEIDSNTVEIDDNDIDNKTNTEANDEDDLNIIDKPEDAVVIDDNTDTSFVNSSKSKKKSKSSSSSSSKKTKYLNNNSSRRSSSIINNNNNNTSTINNSVVLDISDGDDDDVSFIESKSTTAPRKNDIPKSPQPNYNIPEERLVITPKQLNAPMELILKLVGELDQKVKTTCDTPIQQIINIYCAAKSMDPDTVQLKSYGCPLDKDKTPRQLELLDGDILDVSIKISDTKLISLTQSISSIPLSASTSTSNLSSLDPSSSSAVLGDDTPKILLNVRYGNTTHKFKIGTTDPLSKLVTGITKKIGDIPSGKKLILKFDGMALNLQSTPEDEAMEEEDQIDAILK